MLREGFKKTFLISPQALEQISGLVENNNSLQVTIERNNKLKSLYCLNYEDPHITLNESNLSTNTSFSMLNNQIDQKYQVNIDEDRKILNSMSYSSEKELLLDIKPGQNLNMTKEEIILAITAPNQQNLQFREIVLYTYQWYFNEVEQFSFLLARYSMSYPVGMNSSEKAIFDKKVRFNVRHKVICFIKDWFNQYKDILFVVNEMHVLFQEIIYLIHNFTDKNDVLLKFVTQILVEQDVKRPKHLMDGFIERDNKVFEKWGLLKSFGTNMLAGQEKNYDQNIIQIEKSFRNIFYQIEKKPENFCQQLCLFNFENSYEIFLSELVDLNWMKENSVLLAPNVRYISECFDRFSYMITFYLLFESKKKTVKSRVENIIKLIDQLIKNNNYNSAYAAYLSFSNLWFAKSYTISNLNLSKKYNNLYKEIQKLFSLERNNANLRDSMNNAIYPLCLFFGTYQKELNYICEIEQTFDQNKINIRKFILIYESIKRMIVSRNYPYDYKRNEEVQMFQKSFPNTILLEKCLENQSKRH